MMHGQIANSLKKASLNFFVQKTNYLMNMRKNFKNKATLRTSKNTLLFNVRSSWKSFLSAYIEYLLPPFFVNCWFFPSQGTWLRLKKNYDYVLPHEPLINDIHCFSFLDLCWSNLWKRSNWFTYFIHQVTIFFFQVCSTLKLWCDVSCNCDKYTASTYQNNL